MRALVAAPARPGSAGLRDVPEPPEDDGLLLVDGLLLGVCGTDREIEAGSFGSAPEGRSDLLIGHESLGRVREAPANSGFQRGDLVTGLVRHPDPVPCAQCSAGEYDLCTNGRYTERGVVGRDGYGSERWRVQPAFAMKIPDSLGDCGVLAEPASIIAKAFEQIGHVSDQREVWEPRTALVLGAGPIGLLAALACTQRGIEAHVLDRVTSGPKPDLVRRLGGRYHHDTGSLAEGYDLTLECSGTATLMLEAMKRTAPAGTTCLIGIPSAGSKMETDLGDLYRRLVLANQIVIATITANRRHFEEAIKMLDKADHDWLSGLITRRLEMDQWREAFESPKEHVKTIIQLA